MSLNSNLIAQQYFIQFYQYNFMDYIMYPEDMFDPPRIKLGNVVIPEYTQLSSFPLNYRDAGSKIDVQISISNVNNKTFGLFFPQINISNELEFEQVISGETTYPKNKFFKNIIIAPYPAPSGFDFHRNPFDPINERNMRVEGTRVTTSELVYRTENTYEVLNAWRERILTLENVAITEVSSFRYEFGLTSQLYLECTLTAEDAHFGGEVLLIASPDTTFFLLRDVSLHPTTQISSNINSMSVFLRTRLTTFVYNIAQGLWIFGPAADQVHIIDGIMDRNYFEVMSMELRPDLSFPKKFVYIVYLDDAEDVYYDSTDRNLLLPKLREDIEKYRSYHQDSDLVWVFFVVSAKYGTAFPYTDPNLHEHLEQYGVIWEGSEGVGSINYKDNVEKNRNSSLLYPNYYSYQQLNFENYYLRDLTSSAAHIGNTYLETLLGFWDYHIIHHNGVLFDPPQFYPSSYEPLW